MGAVNLEECVFTDLGQRARQGDASEVIAPAECAVTDLGHSLGNHDRFKVAGVVEDSVRNFLDGIAVNAEDQLGLCAVPAYQGCSLVVEQRVGDAVGIGVEFLEAKLRIVLSVGAVPVAVPAAGLLVGVYVDGTAGECVLTDGGDGCGDDNGLHAGAIECVSADLHQRGGQRYVTEIPTALECSVADLDQTFGQLDVGQLVTFCQCVFTNLGQRARQGDLLQLIAVTEGVACERGHALGDNDGDQFVTVIECVFTDFDQRARQIDLFHVSAVVECIRTDAD